MRGSPEFRRVGLGISIALLASVLTSGCAAAFRTEGDSTAPSVSLPEVSLPDVTLPEVSLPEVSAPDVSIPNVTVPQVSLPKTSVTSTTSAEQSDPGSDQNSGGDDGLDLISVLVILLLFAGAVALVASLIQRNRDRRSGGSGARGSDQARRLPQDLLWVQNQAGSVIAGRADLDQLRAAWPIAREHFRNIESEAADAANSKDDAAASAADQAGRSVAALRGSIDAYLSPAASPLPTSPAATSQAPTSPAGERGTVPEPDPTAAIRQAMAQVEAARQVLLAE